MMDQQNNEMDRGEFPLAEVGLTKINLIAKVTPIKEVLDEIAPQGESVKISEFLDQQVVIFSVRPFVGEFGPAAFVVFADQNGELFNAIIGQKIVLPKLLAVMERLPVSATIVKHEGGRFGEYYDIE